MPRPLPFTGPWLLAPMEGITEPCFRSLVLARNPPERLGGAFTEFVRVNDHAVPAWVLREHLGPDRFAAPVGLQLMGSNPETLSQTAEQAEAVGAPVIDLNFGCPAKGALRGCAGSALLRDPSAVERLVRSCVAATRRVPVTAKIRAGYDDDSRVEELARAAQQGGAAMLTVHCRTRKEGYCPEVNWERIARAVGAVSIPVCGNGGASCHADLEEMRRRTGCARVMVGRGALADPWIFSGRAATAAEAAGFLLDYAEQLGARAGFAPAAASDRLKQLIRQWTAGGLCDRDRDGWLREVDPERLLERLRTIAGLASRPA